MNILRSIYGRTTHAIDTVYLLKFIFCCRWRYYKQKRKYPKTYIFEKAKKKLKKEFDIVELMKSMRQLKILVKVIMNRNSKMLIRF